METEQNYNSLFKAANLFVAGATVSKIRSRTVIQGKLLTLVLLQIFAGALQLLNGLNAVSIM